MPKIAIAILAAGSSLRMGQPKQLKTHNGKSLVQIAVDTSMALNCGPVFLIISAELSALVEQQVSQSERVKLVVNTESHEGMASSIRAGVKSALAEESVDALLIMNCDQPDLTEQSLKRLLVLYSTGKIVAAKFNSVIGSPAIFDRAFFPELVELCGDTGAKALFKLHADDLITCDLSEAEFDLDTPSDFEKFISRKSS